MILPDALRNEIEKELQFHRERFQTYELRINLGYIKGIEWLKNKLEEYEDFGGIEYEIGFQKGAEWQRRIDHERKAKESITKNELSQEASNRTYHVEALLRIMDEQTDKGKEKMRTKRSYIMDRCIFRGKRLDNDEWVEGSLIVAPNNRQKSIVIFDEMDSFEFDMIEIDPTTLGQCSGKQAAKGHYIFDGDKFIDPDEPEVLYVANYDKERCRWEMSMRDRKSLFVLEYLEFWNWVNFDHLVFIGTIYDNPELLWVE